MAVKQGDCAALHAPLIVCDGAVGQIDVTIDAGNNAAVDDGINDSVADDQAVGDSHPAVLAVNGAGLIVLAL